MNCVKAYFETAIKYSHQEQVDEKVIESLQDFDKLYHRIENITQMHAQVNHEKKMGTVT